MKKDHQEELQAQLEIDLNEAMTYAQSISEKFVDTLKEDIASRVEDLRD